MKRWLLGAIVPALLVGCSTMTVTTDYVVDVDFAQFRTFQYKETDATVADANPLMHRRIVDGLEQAMVSAGLSQVESDPDVYVSYYGSVREQTVVTHHQIPYAMSGPWDRRSHMFHTTTTATTTRVGTLIIDVWDADEKELVWRGTVSDVLGRDPQRTNERIAEGIARAFEKFPPSTAGEG